MKARDCGLYVSAPAILIVGALWVGVPIWTLAVSASC